MNNLIKTVDKFFGLNQVVLSVAVATAVLVSGATTAHALVYFDQANVSGSLPTMSVDLFSQPGCPAPLNAYRVGSTYNGTEYASGSGAINLCSGVSLDTTSMGLVPDTFVYFSYYNGGTFEGYFVLYIDPSGDPFVEEVTDFTHFISLTPTASSTVATSTTIGANLYIHEDDFEEGMYLHMSFTNQTVSLVGGSALDAWNAGFGSLGIDLPLQAGYNSVATTTVFPTIGGTNGYYSVMKDGFLSSLPLVGDLFNGDVLMASSTYFYVVQKTPTDIMAEQQVSSLNEYLLTGTSTGANLLVNCAGSKILSDGITACLAGLIIPNATLIGAEFERLRTGFLSAWPLGYVSRFIEISLDTGSTTLPSISYTAGDDSMFGPGFTINIDPFGAILASTSPLYYTSDQEEPKTIWEIMEQITYIVVYMALLFMIIHDLTGVAKHSSKHKSL